MPGEDGGAGVDATAGQGALPVGNLGHVRFPVVVVLIGDDDLGLTAGGGDGAQDAFDIFSHRFAGGVAAQFVDAGACRRRRAARSDLAGGEGDQADGSGAGGGIGWGRGDGQSLAAAGRGQARGAQGADRVEDAAGAQVEGVVVRGGDQIDVGGLQRLQHLRLGGVQGQQFARRRAGVRSLDHGFQIGEDHVAAGQMGGDARAAGPFVRGRGVFDQGLAQQAEPQDRRPRPCGRSQRRRARRQKASSIHVVLPLIRRP
ncbi:hypothetical protein D3C85_455220 [compost metagenome]